jgi:hypothetical protein
VQLRTLLVVTDGKTIDIFQPKLIKNLEDSFSQCINTNRKFQTPGVPKTVVLCPEKEDDVLSPKDQTKYHSIWLNTQDLTSQMQ